MVPNLWVILLFTVPSSTNLSEITVIKHFVFGYFMPTLKWKISVKGGHSMIHVSSYKPSLVGLWEDYYNLSLYHEP